MKGSSAKSRDLTRMEKLLARLDEPHRRDVGQLFHQLTVPPDLCHLRDGLRRTCAILQRHGDELDRLLGNMKGSALRSAQMQTTARFLLYDDELWNVRRDSPLLAEMSGTEDPEDHPLYKFCFSVCPYWVILFYGTRNIQNVAPSTLEQGFDELVAEVAVHMIAVNAQKNASWYLNYCQKWATARKRPRSYLTQGSSRNRVQVAARVLARLARNDRSDLLRDLLESGGPNLRLAARLRNVRSIGRRKGTTPQAEKERIQVVDDLEKLVATSASRSGHNVRAGHGGGGGGERGPNGYLRLPSSPLLRDNQLSFGDLTLTIDVLPAVKSPPVEGLTPEDQDPEGDLSISTAFPMVSMPTGGRSPAASGRLLATQASSLLRKLLGAPNTNFRNLSSPQVKRLSVALAHPEANALPWHLEACVKAMLATGRDLRNATVWLQPDLQHARRAGGEGDVHFAFNEEVWLFHLPPPAFAASDAVPWEREHRNEITLPDHLGMAATLKRSFPRLEVPHRLALPPGHEREVKQWLHTITADSRPGIRSLSTFLFARLLQGSGGDLGIATLLTGQSLAHARTTSHYSSYSIFEVLRAYGNALSPIKCATRTSDAEPGYVGARRIPTVDAIMGLLRALCTLIASPTAPSHLRANAYTAYTMAGFHLATAARPAVERVVHDGSDELGFVLLTEKARTPYDYRPVALPAMLHKQLDGYLAFLRRCKPDWQPSEGLFFQYDSSGRPCGAFTPQHFRDLATELGYDMELYALRRFNRTKLVTQERASDEDFGAEDIDALLGHWYERVSPHDPLSTYPPRRLRQLANKPVTRMLEYIGYEMVASP